MTGTIENIQELISQLDELIHRKYHDIAQKYNLTVEQFNLLIELEELYIDLEDGPQAPTVGQIASALKNAQNTMSDRIRRLENKGLVTRRADSKDRRVSRILVSDQGKELLGRIKQEAEQEFLAASLAKMREADLMALEHALRELCRHMQEH